MIWRREWIELIDDEMKNKTFSECNAEWMQRSTQMVSIEIEIIIVVCSRTVTEKTV